MVSSDMGFWFRLEGLAYQAPRSVVRVNDLIRHGRSTVWPVVGACFAKGLGFCLAKGLGFCLEFRELEAGIYDQYPKEFDLGLNPKLPTLNYQP